MRHLAAESALKIDFSGINLACGGKLCFEPGWINADHAPSSREVLSINLLESLPFPDKTFDVVYHSQFIEHLPLDKGLIFLKECYRILKLNGVLRVVTPDLRNQASEYLRLLDEVVAAPADESARLRYKWIRLEMLDQLTRHSEGGDMVGYLNINGHKICDYLWMRMGRSGNNLIPLDAELATSNSFKDKLRLIRDLARLLVNRAMPMTLRVGKFRLSGEPHLFMYDEYTLSRLFKQAGFTDIDKVDALQSRIPKWKNTLLDCDEQGYPDGGASLFMEGVRCA